MKNKKYPIRFSYFLIFFIIIFKANIKADALTIYPSAYFVKGNYSDDRKLTTLSFYNSIKITDRFYVTGAYEYLSLKYPEFTLAQKNYLAGGYLNQFPYFFKLYYSHIDSDILENNYSSNLLSAEIFYFIKPFYLGTAYTFYKINDEQKSISNQVTLRLDWIVSPRIYISLKPNFTFTSTNQKYYSIAGKVNITPTSKFIVKVAGKIGERIYYFDNDLLVHFNQPEVQKYLVNLQVDFNVSDDFALIGGIQNTKFSGYSIYHLIVGLKTKLGFKF